ncbi:MAG: protein kinase [Chitinivibrionales bacterium]|nr:protein kinase [Chitinivibrionales bacterium]
MSASSKPTRSTFTPARHPDVLPGLGKVSAVLGEGGVAWVYEVFNGRLCVYRAVKILKRGMSPQIRSRFEHEARIFPNLVHPHIIRVFSVGEIGGLPYIEMERFHGVSLDILLTECGRLPYRVVLAIALLVCDALQFAHTRELTLNGKRCRGVLHRDLKPANIMIGENGSVKLTDFGAARPADSRLPFSERTLFGSLQYVAPEDMRGEALDVRTDIYSLGCVLYEALVGGRVFPQTDIEELVQARMANRYQSLERDRRGGPRDLRRVVEKCLNESPAERFESAATVEALLLELAERHLEDTPEREVKAYLDALGRPTPTTRQRITRAIAKLVTNGR